MEGFISLLYSHSKTSVGLPRRGFYLNFSSIKRPGLSLRPFFDIFREVSAQEMEHFHFQYCSDDPLFI